MAGRKNLPREDSASPSEGHGPDFIIGSEPLCALRHGDSRGPVHTTSEALVVTDRVGWPGTAIGDGSTLVDGCSPRRGPILTY